MSAKMIYAGLCVGQLITFVAYAVVTIGAALLQSRANNLPLWVGLDAEGLKATTAVYNDVFQSTQYIIPYPQQPRFQFQYQWWIIQFELFIFAMTAICTLFPKLIPRVRPVALTFLASALVLVMDNINAISFLLRNETAKAVFQQHRIETAQAGLMLVGIGNFITIICMGLYEEAPGESVKAPEVKIVADADMMAVVL